MAGSHRVFCLRGLSHILGRLVNNICRQLAVGCQNLTYLLECRVDLLGRVLSRFDCWDLGRVQLTVGTTLLLDLLDLLPDVALK